jgi:hypothetical protein
MLASERFSEEANMGAFRSIRPAAAGVLALAFAMMLGGCAERKAPVAGSPGGSQGGGERRITQILIRAYSKQASAKDRGPVSLSVGERLQLRVMALWAIPAVTEETQRAEWAVSDPAVGQVDQDGVFTARKAGRDMVTAVVRVSKDGAGEVLGPGQSASNGPVKTFRDELEVIVREAPGAAPKSDVR